MRTSNNFLLLTAIMLLLPACAVIAQTAGAAGDPALLERKEAGAGRAELLPGMPVPTRLDAGLAEIDRQYSARLRTLKAEWSACTNADAGDEAQRRIEALKTDWQLATANRQLEIARSRKDSGAELEILNAIQRILTPMPDRSGVRNEPSPSEKIIERGER